jgi:hypothetical protein
LTYYPKDPNGVVPGRSTTGDTPITILAHEAGHLFIAYASVRDRNDSSARPMLGAACPLGIYVQLGSLGSRRQPDRDNGPGVSPRFTTTATVEGYSPLDQYLMGFRTAEEVAPPFLVTGPSRSFATRLPQVGVSFDGQRRDITAADIIAAEGRRTPILRCRSVAFGSPSY